MPASAVTMTFGLASSTRLARFGAEKPPKTTECMAPSLTQASMAKMASGTIGM
jgi:hypothetical protein